MNTTGRGIGECIQLHDTDWRPLLRACKGYLESGNDWAEFPDAIDEEAVEIRAARSLCRELIDIIEGRA